MDLGTINMNKTELHPEEERPPSPEVLGAPSTTLSDLTSWLHHLHATGW